MGHAGSSKISRSRRSDWWVSGSGAARGPGAIAGRGFPTAEASRGRKGTGGAHQVDVEVEPAPVVHVAAGGGSEESATDLSVGDSDCHVIPVRAFAGIGHGLDMPTAVERRSRLTGRAR